VGAVKPSRSANPHQLNHRAPKGLSSPAITATTCHGAARRPPNHPRTDRPPATAPETADTAPITMVP